MALSLEMCGHVLQMYYVSLQCFIIKETIRSLHCDDCYVAMVLINDVIAVASMVSVVILHLPYITYLSDFSTGSKLRLLPSALGPRKWQLRSKSNY